ncbi:MAG: Fe-S cluster assembly protein SufD [Prevotella sp.]|nr:Fe-S cluster assembly protein SufD [Prevotella sp.]
MNKETKPGVAGQYTALYEREKETVCGCSADVLNACRQHAYEVFRTSGLPSRKTERYRYTDMRSLFAPDYGVNIRRQPVSFDPYKAFRCFVPNLNSLLYFVVNDTFCPPAFKRTELPGGVIIDSLNSFAATRPELIRSRYNYLAGDDDAVSAVNTMFAQDGLLVYVPSGVRLKRPVQIVNMSHSPVNMMANRRVLIVLEEDSELNILFCDHTDSDSDFLITQVAEIFLEENAALDITCVEESHRRSRRVSNTYIRQEARSRLTYNNITLHNGVTRESLDIRLQGEGAGCRLNGCAIIDGEQHADCNTLITHAAAHCTSNELYKYVLNDAATGAFAGKVLVCKGAQNTDSAMRNQNLCATNQARMSAQPMLEIYADDVKCSHGATVGQLNNAALFYMQQRGIPLQEAKRLLQTAFVSEVIDNIRIAPVRDRLRYLVEKRFRGELNKCEGCSLCL